MRTFFDDARNNFAALAPLLHLTPNAAHIFGELSRLYLESKDQFQAVALQHTGASAASGASAPGDDGDENSMSSLS